jgi:hypothetical protein
MTILTIFDNIILNDPLLAIVGISTPGWIENRYRVRAPVE